MNDNVTRKTILFEDLIFVGALFGVLTSCRTLLHLTLKIQTQIQLTKFFVLFNVRNNLTNISTFLSQSTVFGVGRFFCGMKLISLLTISESLFVKVLSIEHGIALFVDSVVTVIKIMITFLEFIFELSRII